MKKLICLLFAVMFVITVMPSLALAQSGLSIESSGIYDGMDKSYSQGYMPRVKNGYAYIVLPLVGDTEGDVITVTPQLDTDGPFVYGNYIFNVKKANGVYLIKLNLPLRADRQNGLYPVIFDIGYFAKAVQLANGEKTESTEAEQSFTVYVSITDGKEPSPAAELFITGYKVAPATVKSGEDFTVDLTIKNIGGSVAKKVRLSYEGNDEGTISPKNALNIIRIDDIKAGEEKIVKFAMKASKDTESGRQAFIVSITYDGGEMSQRLYVEVLQPNQPKPEKEKQPAELFITDYKVSPKQVNGGDDFDVTVTIKNIGGSAAEKIRLTYDGAEGESGKVITPKTALNTKRVASIKAGAERKVKFTMTASKDAVAGKQSFSVAITYSGGELMQMLNVNVIQPLDVSVDEIQMPQEVMSGESVMIPISILNKGKAAIYDVTAKLDMDGCYGSSVYIGEVAAGTTGYAEMKVFIGTLSQGSLYGGTFGSLNITYKEADGSEYTDTTELRTTITEPQSEDENKADTDEEQPKLQPVSQWYVSVIVGIAVIAIAVAVIMIMSYQRKLRLK